MKYKTIYCDPPWSVDENRTISKSWINLSNNYKTMTLKELKDMKDFIQQLADPEGCHLYMWVTGNSLIMGTQLMEYWGFKYITNVVWNKTTGSGLGNYFKNHHEICLFGRMNVIKQNKKQYVRSVISAPRRQHSRKPDEMYDLIEKVSPGPYIELFARQTKEGWDSWGNEVGKFDKGETK